MKQRTVKVKRTFIEQKILHPFQLDAYTELLLAASKISHRHMRAELLTILEYYGVERDELSRGMFSKYACPMPPFPNLKLK